ncbi:hypothetical protein [Arthrobacter sp. Leaf69]|uniref:hypothetical protein n=1 Tax=Arthrobacter sp. Leaf69 TaxID=1736232 RepID=UPI0006F97467|nr:hypothetical protein [Arthrobacter sp. Leaf69]KQN94889.1 hypothetical protein ASE96_01450 [Arthrobacter sp. Leaf69]
MGDIEERRARTLLRRIEHLITKLNRRKFLSDGLEEFSPYQEKIAALQRDVQRAITETKVKARKDKKQLAHLRDLQVIRWHSRRLGDGLAWMVLLFDRKTIRALTTNSRVPLSSEEDDGSRGVSVTAMKLLQSGFGLPIIHDITDCLRIGDITFLSFGDGAADKLFRTIEVKTSRLDASVDDKGKENVSLQVTAIGTEPFPPIARQAVLELGTFRAEELENPERKPRREDRRLDKQFNRMVKAVAHRTAEDHKLTKIDGSSHLSLVSDVEDHHHWAELRKAIRHARSNGYAFFSVDNFIGYGLWFNPNGVVKEDVADPRFVEDIQSHVLSDDLGDRNSLTIGAIPIEEDNAHAPLLMPFTVYEIPQRAISDILHGRLVIMAAMNTGHVERALADAGLKVELEPGARDGRSFKLRTTLQWPTGERLSVEIPAPWLESMAAMHEFLGIESIVSKTSAIKSVPERMSFEEFASGRDNPLREEPTEADSGVV